MIKIYDYTDYKRFMHDWFEFKRSSNQNFTYGVWARILDLNSSTTITKIINSQRHPGPMVITKLVIYFNFDQREASYFKILVKLHEHIQDESIGYFLDSMRLGMSYSDCCSRPDE